MSSDDDQKDWPQLKMPHDGWTMEKFIEVKPEEKPKKPKKDGEDKGK